MVRGTKSRQKEEKRKEKGKRDWRTEQEEKKKKKRDRGSGGMDALKYIWEGAIPLQIHLHESEVTTVPPPPPAMVILCFSPSAALSLFELSDFRLSISSTDEHHGFILFISLRNLSLFTRAASICCFLCFQFGVLNDGCFLCVYWTPK